VTRQTTVISRHTSRTSVFLTYITYTKYEVECKHFWWLFSRPNPLCEIHNLWPSTTNNICDCVDSKIDRT